MTPEKTRELLAAYAGAATCSRTGPWAASTAKNIVSTGEVHEYPAGHGELASVPEWSTLDFYRRQKKVILRNCGSIDPHGAGRDHRPRHLSRGAAGADAK